MGVAVPDAREEAILERNGLDPKQFGIVRSEKDHLLLLNYSTRDNVAIYQGDKKW